ncbi:MalM family protein [Vibrio anguillarum]|uniref:MalM family protein n=1 Tax=Vibrio anguillarum TaxID=55601 RepID=UPI0018FE034D|nr:MalM family protein [Vibrio anguillarum]MBF4424855.1 transcriptional regulator [Vibrio anguillarum]
MVFKTLLLGSCIALTGCQTAPVVEQTQSSAVQAVNNIEQLQVTKVKLPSTTKMVLTANTQRLHNSLIHSPVAVFEIPADRGQMNLTVTSEIQDSVFYPYVVITDKTGTVLESYTDTEFEYRKPRLNLGNRLVADLEFYPPQGHKTLLLIVYTKEKDLSGVTYVAHPGRIDAEGRGNYMPELKDIPMPHGLTGTIELDVSGPSFLSFVKSENKVKTVSTDEAKLTKKVQPDTETYYKVSIKKAVKANDIAKALSLLDEAKALGIDGAQEVFVKAVNEK